MRVFICLLIFFIPGMLLSQVDVERSQLMLISIGNKRTVHQGVLMKQSYVFDGNGYILQQPEFPDYHCNGPGADFRFINFSRQLSIAVSWESIPFLAGEALGNSTEKYSGGFKFIAGQLTKELVKDVIPELADEQKRWINLKYIEANSTYGLKDIQFGLHFAVRELGYYNFSNYDSENFGYRVTNTSAGKAKLLIGPAVGYRKTFNDLAILAFASASISPNLANAYVMKYSPHVEASVFYGKKIGVFGSLYFRQFFGQEFMFGDVPTSPNFKEYALNFGLYFLTGE